MDESQKNVRELTKERRRQNSQRLMAQLQEVLPSILANFPVSAAYVYGSVAEGTMTPLSDIDIAILIADPLPSYDQLKLEMAIQGNIEEGTGFHPVDVRAINTAPLLVQGQVVQQGVLVYEGDRTHRIDFEVATRKRFFDFAPVARRTRDAFLTHIHQKGLLDG